MRSSSLFPLNRQSISSQVACFLGEQVEVSAVTTVGWEVVGQWFPVVNRIRFGPPTHLDPLV